MRLDHLLSKEHPLEESGKSGQQTGNGLRGCEKAQKILFNFEVPGDRDFKGQEWQPETLTWGCSSAGRAPALHAGGQEFDPPHLHQGFEVGKRKRRGSKNMGS